jgi:signal peptidase I
MNEQIASTFQQNEVPQNSIRSSIVDFAQSIVIALSICIIIYIFLATPNQIEGKSMEPNFSDGQIVLTSKVNQWLGSTPLGKNLDLDYKRGDIVVFQKPGFNDFIKRIVGVPGDKVQIRDGYIYINDEKLDESYLPVETYTTGGNFIEDNGDSKTVPAGQYFAIGDNRNNSHDSRYLDIGFISRDWMKGKVIVRYWPIRDFKLIRD